LSNPIGSGCNAGGFQNCKYCGFDRYQICPSKSIIRKFQNSDSSDDYVIDFDKDNTNIVLNLNINETEQYTGDLKVDYSYEDDGRYKVTDISSISNII
jgi:hypothetical protein